MAPSAAPLVSGRLLLLCAASIYLTGCSAIQSSRNENMDVELVKGDYRAAALLAESRMGLEPDKTGQLPPVVAEGKNILNHLDAGAAWFVAGDADRSLSHFDAAEVTLKAVETQNVAASGAKLAGAALINEGALDYVPSPAEGILVNYYKALAFLGKNDPDNARVELNRSGERTRRAVERYAAEIAEAEAKAAEKGKNYAKDQKVQAGVSAQYQEMSQWVPYKEFIVPPVTYLQALTLGRSGDADDRQKGLDLYKRITDISESNPTVALDAKDLESGKVCPSNKCVWIMVEHGLGPSVKEKRFDLPVPTPSGLIIASMALPSLESRTTTDLIPFRVTASNQTVQVPMMASMDRVVQSEFQKRFPGVLTRSITQAVAKGIAQDQLNKLSPLAGLAANLASAVSTGADLRSWRSMPGRWALARIDKTPGQKLTLETASGLVDVQVPESGSHLVYIKAISDSVAPLVEVIPL